MTTKAVWFDGDVNAALLSRMSAGSANLAPSAQWSALVNGGRWVRYDLNETVARLLTARLDGAEEEDPNDVARRLLGLPERERGELVRVDLACPTCGMRDMDELRIDDDDHVACSRCGTSYQAAA